MEVVESIRVGFKPRVRSKLRSRSNHLLLKIKARIFLIILSLLMLKVSLTQFSNIQFWNHMYELVFVLSPNDFDTSNPLKGTIYLDNISIIEK